MPPNATKETVLPWHTDPDAFPPYASDADRLRFVLNYAVLAPSGHNSQPWKFEVREHEVALYADRSRARRTVDPNDRELILSCGGALYNLRVALRRYGYLFEVDVFPDPANPDMLALLRLTGRQVPEPENHVLFDAIPKRHTNRGTFDARPIPDALLEKMAQAGREEGAKIHWVRQDGLRARLADLVAEADEIHFSDPEYREELAHWVRSDRSRQPDGVPAAAMDGDRQVASIGGMLPHVVARGRQIGDTHARLLVDAPAVAVVTTPQDDPAAWLAAGQAMQSALLLATANGLSASFFNAPIEVAELRFHLKSGLAETGYPQVVFRLGYADAAPETPRRGADQVTD